MKKYTNVRVLMAKSRDRQKLNRPVRFGTSVLWVLLLLSADYPETVKASNGPVSHNVTPSTIKAKPMPMFRVLEPSFVGPIKNVTGALGREGILTCSVEDLGDHKVAWIRADDQTILTVHDRLVTHSSRYSVVNDPSGSWQLHIRPLKVSDRGCYMCQINSNIMMNQVGCIDVLVPPNIIDEGTSSDIIVQEGSDAVITCAADGRPEPRILWRREDGGNVQLRNASGVLIKVDAYTGSSLNLSKVDRKQMGAYLCIASNDIPPSVSKRIMLTVNFSPTVKVRSRIVKVVPGAQAKLDCITETNPPANTYWIKRGEDVIISGEKYEIFEKRLSIYEVRTTLAILNFSADDSGSYTCHSSNAFGKADGTVRVYEIKTTTTTSTTTTTTTTNSPKPMFTVPTTTSEYTSSLTHLMVSIHSAERSEYHIQDAAEGTITNVIDESVMDIDWMQTAETTTSDANRNTPVTIQTLINELPFVFHIVYYSILLLIFIAATNH